jgi:hypothetical protein
MKRKSAELDVDFIGGQNPMTKEEENSISEFLKAQKLLRAKKLIRSAKATRQNKSIAKS